MKRWWHVSPKRVVIALVVVFALMWILGKAVGWLAPWAEARSMLRDNAALAQLPAPIPDRSLTALSDDSIVFFGLTVRTPWGRFGTIRSTPGIAMIPFPDRQVAMILYEPREDDFVKRMWKEAQPNYLKTGVSNFNLMAAEMATTPSEVQWWKSPNENEARYFLLEMKSLDLGDMKAIYSVGIGEWRGFQEGNPALPPYRVRLDLFDLADYHYQIVISGKNGGGPAFSQAELNAMVVSLKPIPHN